MKLNVKALRTAMLGAAKEAVTDRWPALEGFAEMQFSKLSLALFEIQRLHAAGKLDRNRAQELAIAEQNGIRGILGRVRGLGRLTVEQATHAATRAVAAEVNAAVGFKLL